MLFSLLKAKILFQKSILYIENSQGERIKEFEKKEDKTKKENPSKGIFSKETSIIMTSILEDVVKRRHW